jgi:hypothetical protein
MCLQLLVFTLYDGCVYSYSYLHPHVNMIDVLTATRNDTYVMDVLTATCTCTYMMDVLTATRVHTI